MAAYTALATIASRPAGRPSSELYCGLWDPAVPSMAHVWSRQLMASRPPHRECALASREDQNLAPVWTFR